MHYKAQYLHDGGRHPLLASFCPVIAYICAFPLETGSFFGLARFRFQAWSLQVEMGGTVLNDIRTIVNYKYTKGITNAGFPNFIERERKKETLEIKNSQFRKSHQFQHT